jgi:hypothetical protein
VQSRSRTVISTSPTEPTWSVRLALTAGRRTPAGTEVLIVSSRGSSIFI